MSLTERTRVSRMREIRTSGLKRGEEPESLALSYSTWCLGWGGWGWVLGAELGWRGWFVSSCQVFLGSGWG